MQQVDASPIRSDPIRCRSPYETYDMYVRSIRPYSTPRHLTDEFELTCLTQQSTNRAPTRRGRERERREGHWDRVPTDIWGWCYIAGAWCWCWCWAMQLVHYLINGTQPFRGWLLCFIVGFLFDFFLWASFLPHGGAATATEHKFSYNFKQRGA